MPPESSKDDLPASRVEIAGPGAQRAAAVLLGLGPEIATHVFRLLDETTIRYIALGARELRKSPQAVPAAIGAFVQAMDSLSGDAVAGDGLLREMASKALGADMTRRAFDGIIPPPPPDDTLGAVGQADPESLAMILMREQPQTAALVLGSLETTRAASVMRYIPERLRPPILRRLASLESVAPEVLQQVSTALNTELSETTSVGSKKVDGKAQAVNLLRRFPAAQQSEVVAEIEKEDPDLATDMRARLFTFEDLGNLSDRDIQTLIREIDMAQLAVALKGATQTVKDKLMKNMSQRAAQMLADDIAAMGPVKLAAVESAQAELVKIAFSLAEQGRITIVGPADKMI